MAGPADATAPGLMQALAALAPEFAAYSAAQVVVFVPCLVAIRRAWPQHKDPWSLADTFVSLAVFPLLTASAIKASWSLHHDLELRWRGVMPETRFFLFLYTTRAVLHCFMQCMQQITPSHRALMTLHHILSVLCFGGGLITGTMHFWGCLDGCCEMSTIFLNNLYICKGLTIGGKEFKEIVPSWFYAANGLCLWLSFLVFRIALFPLWLYAWHRDVTTAPAATWDRSTVFERYLYPSVTVFLFLLSAHWFVPITKGMLKAMGFIESETFKKADDGSTLKLD